MSYAIVPVAAVAETVATSAASFRIMAGAKELPLKVLVPVKVLFPEAVTHEKAWDDHVVPLEVSKLPVLPGATT